MDRGDVGWHSAEWGGDAMKGSGTQMGAGPEQGNAPQGRSTGAGKDAAAPEFDPPCDVIEPLRLASCLVLSSPHSGSLYPAGFLQSARLDAASLRRSEDAFVDELFLPAVGLGLPLLRARFPRSYLDANREPYELDPRMFEGRLPPYANTRSVRVAGGLGTIARVVGDAQEIYAGRLRVEEGLRRIEELHKPYHAALRMLTDRAVRRFGRTLLIDCHSMPSCSPAPGHAARDERAKADVVLGDRYGTSCDRLFADAAEYELRRCGYVVERNKPYAGGYITEHYGQPGTGRHALQIEVNRALYMDERSLRKLADFDTVASHLRGVVKVLAGLLEAGPAGEREAAE